MTGLCVIEENPDHPGYVLRNTKTQEVVGRAPKFCEVVRMAQIVNTAMHRAPTPAPQCPCAARVERLERALIQYWSATRGFLRTPGASDTVEAAEREIDRAIAILKGESDA